MTTAVAIPPTQRIAVSCAVAAELASCSLRRIETAIATGELRAYTPGGVGRARRILVTDLVAWITADGADQPVPA